MKSDLVDIECRVVSSRDASIAVADGTTEQLGRKSEREKWFWLPRSQIEIEVLSGGKVRVTMPEWLAIEKGLV